MIANLGSVMLSTISAPSSLGLQIGFDYANHDKPLGKPSQQRLGGKLDVWRLQFSLHYQFCDPQQSLDELSELVRNGKPVPLVFEFVDYRGSVTVNDLDVTYTQTAINGKPLIIEGSLTLTEYAGEMTDEPVRPAVKQGNHTPVLTTTGNAQNLDVANKSAFAQKMNDIAKQFRAVSKDAGGVLDDAYDLQNKIKRLVTRR